MKEFIAEKRETLKEFTDNRYPQGSFYWEYLLKNKEIKVNGVKVKENVWLSAGDKVAYYLKREQEEKPAFYLVYEDENVLIVDKESGVNSEAVYAALREERECFFLHRLDRNTKGLMIFALTADAEGELLSAFKERRIDKKYEAILFGSLPKEQDVLTAYLKKDERNAKVTVLASPAEGAEKIVTEYRVIQRRGEMTKAEIFLHTGKTHQIRAHFAYLGAPVAGDEKYGDSALNKKYQWKRQLLVAKSLSFRLTGNLKYLNGKTFVSRFSAELPNFVK